MVQLGRHHGTGPASLAEIAAVEDMPRAYLEQLAFVLRDAGLVVSTRGAHGGYELARPPEAIHMSEVLRALEGPHGTVPKLQVLATFVSTGTTDPKSAHPAAHPRVCA